MKIIIVAVFLFISSFISAQDSGRAERSLYYQQRASLFDLLPNTENEIIFLGNSITDGGEWIELFDDKRVKNRGISGDVTDGILDRLDEVVESKPLKIFIMIGINDLAFGSAVDKVVFNYKKILQEIISKSPNTKIYIQSVLPVNNNFAKFKDHVNKSSDILLLNEELKKLAIIFKCEYIDLYKKFEKDGKLDSRYTNDGLHLTGKGYILWRSELAPYIRE